MQVLPLTEYEPNLLHEGRMIRWFGQLCQSEKLEEIFFYPPASMLDFLKFFSPPNLCVYSFDTVTMEMMLVAWWERVGGNGGMMGFWANPTIRHQRVGILAGQEIYEYGLNHFDVILGTVKNEKLLVEHRRIGYTVLDKIPKLWGTGIYPVYLTREGWNQREFQLIERRTQWVEEAAEKVVV